MSVIIRFHARGCNKQALAGNRGNRVVVGYRESSGSFSFLLAEAERRMGEKVRKRRNCERCLFFLPQLPVAEREISVV